MSRPVTTDKWAGNYDCSVCRRKRLVGAEFSKKMLEKYRKNSSHKLKCKNCVAEQETKERELAAAKRELEGLSIGGVKNSGSSNTGKNVNEGELVQCSACKKEIPSSAYNKSQLSKGEGKARCRSCVEKSIADEAKQEKEAKAEKLAKAKERVRVAQEKGKVAEIVKAEAELCALEAEIVTGLKPKVIGRGKGRGGRGGRAFSRGRGGRGSRGGRGRT